MTYIEPYMRTALAGHTPARDEYSRHVFGYAWANQWIFDGKLDGSAEVQGRSDRATIPLGIEDAIPRTPPDQGLFGGTP